MYLRTLFFLRSILGHWLVFSKTERKKGTVFYVAWWQAIWYDDGADSITVMICFTQLKLYLTNWHDMTHFHTEMNETPTVPCFYTFFGSTTLYHTLVTNLLLLSYNNNQSTIINWICCVFLISKIFLVLYSYVWMNYGSQFSFSISLKKAHYFASYSVHFSHTNTKYFYTIIYQYHMEKDQNQVNTQTLFHTQQH